MRIYPAIDLLGGHCVRLRQGDFNSATSYSENPVEVAQQFHKAGANWLHVVDLDGARLGSISQFEQVQALAEIFKNNIQVGGGVRSESALQKYFRVGISRVIIGSIALLQPREVVRWLEDYGSDRLVLACDVHVNDKGIPMIASHGWQERSETSLAELLNYYVSAGLKHVLCTDIARDGLLQGPNLDLYASLQRDYPDLEFQASGGVSSMQDILALNDQNISGVIVGKAIYEGKISLDELFKAF